MKCRLPAVKFSSGRDFKYSTSGATSLPLQSEIEGKWFDAVSDGWKNSAELFPTLTYFHHHCCRMYPFSTKTREVSENPSLTPMRLPDTGEKSQGSMEISIKGGVEEDGFLNNFQILVDYGHSHVINLSAGSGSVSKSILLC